MFFWPLLTAVSRIRSAAGGRRKPFNETHFSERIRWLYPPLSYLVPENEILLLETFYSEASKRESKLSKV